MVGDGGSISPEAIDFKSPVAVKVEAPKVVQPVVQIDVRGGGTEPGEIGAEPIENKFHASTPEVVEVKSLSKFLQEASLEDRAKVDYPEGLTGWRRALDGWIADTGSKLEVLQRLARQTGGDVNKYLMSLYNEDYTEANIDKFMKDLAGLNLSDQELNKLYPQIRAVAGFFGERVGSGLTMISIKQMIDESLRETTTQTFVSALDESTRTFLSKLDEFMTPEEIQMLVGKIKSEEGDKKSPNEAKQELQESGKPKEVVSTGSFQIVKGYVKHPQQELDEEHWNGGDYSINASELGITEGQMKQYGELQVLMDTATDAGREGSPDTKKFAEAFIKYFYDSTNYGKNDIDVRAREAYDYAKGMFPAQAAFAYLLRQGDLLSYGAVGNINVVKQSGGIAQYLLDMRDTAETGYVDKENPEAGPVLKSKLTKEEVDQWEAKIAKDPNRFSRGSATILIASEGSRLRQSKSKLSDGDIVIANTDGFWLGLDDYPPENIEDLIGSIKSNDDVTAILTKN